jgi:hypothetical protein
LFFPLINPFIRLYVGINTIYDKTININIDIIFLTSKSNFNIDIKQSRLNIFLIFRDM